MKRRGLFPGALLLLLTAKGDAAIAEAPEGQMRVAVEKLVKAAESRTTLWPWSGPIHEVAEVAAYGKAVAPLLVNLLADDPDALDESSPGVDWNVQQQVALALCKIYGVTEEAGHVYLNRASREENSSVKRFWLHEVYQR
jgi:hypothetical protein